MNYFEPIDKKLEIEMWKFHGKSIDSVKDDIKALKNWLNSQPHLPHTLNDNQIKAFLLMNKGSMEKAKPKIDMYYTMRTIYPDIFQNSNPFSARILQARKYMYYLPLPKLCADLSRILVIKVKDVGSLNINSYACIAHSFNVVEVRLLEEKCLAHTTIIDLEHAKINQLVNLTPTICKSIYTILSKAFTTKLTAVHLINAPSFIDQVLLIIKSVLPKLVDKVVIHKDITSMLEAVDKNVLPKEYGGNERSLDELEELLYKKFEEYKEFFDQNDRLRVKEELRPAENRNDEFLGYYGNFKQLEVD